MLAPTYNRTVSLVSEEGYLSYKQKGALGYVKRAGSDLTQKYLPAQGRNTFGKKTISDYLTFIDLKSVYSISVSHVSGVAVENGLFTSFLQPWYIQPIQITIKGASYLGAYPFLSSRDRELERLLKLYYASLNDFSNLHGAAGNRKRIVMILNGYPDKSKAFNGYITDLTSTESIENANLVDYTLKYVGYDISSADAQAGLAAGAQDKK